MTRDEALLVCSILDHADGGCSHCAADLYQRFNEKFPGFEDALDESWAGWGTNKGDWRE